MMAVIGMALAWGLLGFVVLLLCLALVIGILIARDGGIGFYGAVRIGLVALALFGLGLGVVERLGILGGHN